MRMQGTDENKAELREAAMAVLAENILAWYPQVRRELPWRQDPTPYHVWISEIMLQQTRIEAVRGYYARFLAYFPTIRDLASAEEQNVLKAWEGLGYYSRAKNLMKAAKICVERYDGELPDNYEQLLSLPGIGAYTAGAVGSIAFSLSVPAVDGNVLRVLTRYLADPSDITKGSVKTALEERVRDILPKEKAGEFNQALMELGEVVCIPNGKPLCEQCPLHAECLSHQTGEMELYPVKSAKKARKIQDMTVLLLRYGDSFAIRRRPEEGLLAGLYEFPWLDGHQSREDIENWMQRKGIGGRILGDLPAAKHIFSHVEWHMIGWEIEVEECNRPELGEWHTVNEIHSTYPIPVAMKKYDRYLTS